jgi:hypothetical protein
MGSVISASCIGQEGLGGPPKQEGLLNEPSACERVYVHSPLSAVTYTLFPSGLTTEDVGQPALLTAEGFGSDPVCLSPPAVEKMPTLPPPKLIDPPTTYAVDPSGLSEI